MASGHLVDDDLVESVVRERLAMHDWNYGFVVDGFPRNARQAEFFLESYDIDGVIHLASPTRRWSGGCWPAGSARAAGWTTTSSPTAPSRETLRRLRRRPGLPRPTTTPKRWPSGCGSTTRRPAR